MISRIIVRTLTKILNHTKYKKLREFAQKIAIILKVDIHFEQKCHV